jgi:dTDP-4-amino-4,6-dideoxygalactose transaminase
VHRFSIYEDFYTPLPKTDYAADNMITLPLYSKLYKELIQTITISLQHILSDL